MEHKNHKLKEGRAGSDSTRFFIGADAKHDSSPSDRTLLSALAVGFAVDERAVGWRSGSAGLRRSRFRFRAVRRVLLGFGCRSPGRFFGFVAVAFVLGVRLVAPPAFGSVGVCLGSARVAALSFPVSCRLSGGVGLRLAPFVACFGCRVACRPSRFWRFSVGWGSVAGRASPFSASGGAPFSPLRSGRARRQLELPLRFQNVEFCIIPARPELQAPAGVQNTHFGQFQNGSSADGKSVSPRLRHPRRGFFSLAPAGIVPDAGQP